MRGSYQAAGALKTIHTASLPTFTKQAVFANTKIQSSVLWSGTAASRVLPAHGASAGLAITAR